MLYDAARMATREEWEVLGKAVDDQVLASRPGVKVPPTRCRSSAAPANMRDFLFGAFRRDRQGQPDLRGTNQIQALGVRPPHAAGLEPWQRPSLRKGRRPRYRAAFVKDGIDPGSAAGSSTASRWPGALPNRKGLRDLTMVPAPRRVAPDMMLVLRGCVKDGRVRLLHHFGGISASPQSARARWGHGDDESAGDGRSGIAGGMRARSLRLP